MRQASSSLLLALLCGRTAAQLQSYLMPNDIKEMQEKALAGVKGQDPENVYYGTKLLLAMGKGAELQGAKGCDVSTLLITRNPTDLASVAYGGAAAKAAGCSVALGEAAATVANTLTTGHEGSSFESKYLSVLGSASLGVGVTEIDAAMKKIAKAYRDGEGLFKHQPTDRSGDSARTFLMLDLITQTVSPSLKSSSKGIRHTLDKASLLLPGVNPEADARTDATLLAPLAQAVAEPLSLSDAQALGCATSLLALKAAPSLQAAYKVYAGLSYLAGLPNAPLAVSLSSSMLQPNEPLALTVHPLLGGALKGVSVTLERLTLPAKNTEFEEYRDKTLKQQGDGTFAADLSLGGGKYDVSLIVSLKDRALSVTRSLVVKGNAQVKDVTITISPSRKATEGTAYPSQLPPGLSASASDGDWLFVSFFVDAPTPPHQAFLRLTHLESNLDTYFTAKRTRDVLEATPLVASLSIADETNTFLSRSGAYQLSLLIGDVILSKGMELNLGSLSLTFPPKPKLTHPLYSRPLLHDSDISLVPMPVIEHQFRAPEKRPTPLIPAVFTLLIAACLAGFILSLRSLGANSAGLPSGPGLLWTCLLFGCLTAFVLSFTAYFIAVKMITLLTALLPLSAVTILTGHRAFTASAAKRMAQTSN